MASRWIPRITPLGAGGGGPPPQIQDHFCPKIIVGNVPAGDPAVAQAAPFQYIPDPGDGTGIAAALAALPPGGGDVCVRPGPYVLSAAVLPFTVPAASTVFGAGQGTVLFNPTARRQVFSVSTGGVVKQVEILQAAATPGSIGTEVISLATDASFLYSAIAFQGASPDETLTAMVRTAAAATRSRVEAVKLFDLIDTIAGVVLDGTDHTVEDLALTGAALAAVRFEASSERCTAQNVRGAATSGFVVNGSRHAMDGSIDVAAAGIGADFVDCNRCRVELISQGATPAAGSYGVRVRSGVRNVVNGCVLESHATGVAVDAGATRTIVLGNQLEAVTSPLLDAGTLTEAAHNGLIVP